MFDFIKKVPQHVPKRGTPHLHKDSEEQINTQHTVMKSLTSGCWGKKKKKEQTNKVIRGIRIHIKCLVLLVVPQIMTPRTWLLAESCHSCRPRRMDVYHCQCTSQGRCDRYFLFTRECISNCIVFQECSRSLPRSCSL